MSIYDPPADPYGDDPLHGECSVCHEVHDYGDMSRCAHGKEICHDCLDSLTSKFPARLFRQVESVIKRHGVTTPDEISEYLET